MGTTIVAHIVVLAFPFGTHAAPLHSLTCLLASAAPHAIFSFIGSAKSNASLAAVPSPDNLSLYAIHDGCPERFYSQNPEDEVRLFLKACPGNFVEGVAKAVRDQGGAAVACVVSDCFLPFAREVAEGLGVGWVALWTGGACSLSAHVYTDDIRRSVGVGHEAISPKLDDNLVFPTPLSFLKVRDLQEGIVSGNVNSPFSRLLHDMSLVLPNATAVALNSFHSLEPHVIADLSTKLPNCFPLGPLNLFAATLHRPQPDHSPCLDWLHRRSPSSVAYIAFGSLLTPPLPELTALADALEASGAHFLWSLKKNAQALLPKGFVDRTAGKGLVVEWAPQVHVLRHEAVGAFVTHCGWNSVMEGLTGGVPMICRPFLGDQRVNARLVTEAWGVGVCLEGGVITKIGVVGAIEKLLASDEGTEMRERALAIKARADEAVGDDGSSVRCFKDLVKIVCGF